MTTGVLPFEWTAMLTRSNGSAGWFAKTWSWQAGVKRLIERPQQACCGIMLAIAGICGLTPLVSPQLDPDVAMSHLISQADAMQADAMDERDRSITVNRLVNVTRNLMNSVSTLSLFDAKAMRNAFQRVWAYSFQVGFLRQLGAVLLLLLSFAAPAMACMAPYAEMTVEERACCRMMKNDCGQMEMAASHNCCKKTPGTLHDSALRSAPVSFHPLVAVVWVSLFDLFPPHDATNGWVQRPEHSPPKPPPSITSALRV